jgi:predicted hydrocarbon binding protein
MRRDVSALREFFFKKRDGLVIKIVLCHELAQLRQVGSRVCALAYGVLVGLLAL